MYIKFKTKEFATEFIDTIKKNKEKSLDFKEFGTWEFNCADEKKNGITITYRNKKTNYIVLIHVFINRDAENQISFNTYERYDEMYAPLFYNEYKQLFYHDYFIGE
jgi:hypothetical protein